MAKKLDRASVEELLSLTPMQQGMLFHYLVTPESEMYFEQISFRLVGKVDPGLVRNAWDRVIKANPSLRTVFRWNNMETPVQIILKEHTVLLHEFDFSDLTEETARIEKIEAIRAQDRQEKFDLEEVPFRVTLCKFEAEEYEMIVSNHHILYDGWSNTLVIKEFFQAYDTLLAGRTDAPLNKTHVKEYIKYLRSQDKVQQRSYWEALLAGFDRNTLLPYDTGVLHTVGDFVPGDYKYEFSKELSAKAHQFVKERQMTMATLLYTAWGIVLQKHNQKNDVLFGTTVSGRALEVKGIENMVGLFMNTVPLRFQAVPQAVIADVLRQVHTQVMERDAFSNTSLVEIKEYAKAHGQQQLFDCMVAVENFPLEGIFEDHYSLQIKSLSVFEMTNFDLSLGISVGDPIVVKFKFNTKLYDEATMAKIADHFQRIVEQVLENPQARIGDLEIVTEAEKQQLLVDFIKESTTYPRDKSVADLFAEQAAATPDATAVVLGDQSLTYGELDRKANQLAHALQAQGVGAEELVGLSMERSLDMIVGMLGILKAGSAYVPLDPAYPNERLAYMLEDAQVSVLVTQERLVEKLPNVQAHVICLDADWPKIAQMPTDPPKTSAKATSLAYVIYTSGSTGLPKGVLVPHRGIVRLVKNNDYVDFSPDHVFLQASTISFDAATFEIWGSLLNGAQLALMPPQMPTLEELRQAICDYGVTTLWLTVGLFNLMVDSRLEALKGVKQLLVGGDALSIPHVRKAFALKGMRLINGYGPTESTTFTCCHPIREEDLDSLSIPIGRPIANTKVYVLDDLGHLVPPGVPGELCIGGDGLASGYLNRPELTEERFIRNPFSTGSEERLYKTGDLVRYLPDGCIEFIGRIDNQVKIRGFRIELSEIEAVLSLHQEVKQAVVLAREDVPGEKRLVAYVEVDVPEKEGLNHSLRRYLKDKMPDYMIPSAFLLLDRLPLTANGKVDKKALPAPDQMHWMSEAGYVAPRNETEVLIANIWAKVLHLNQVGVNDNFFEIGGHSLLATQTVSRLREAFGVELPLRVLFDQPTVADLAEQIQLIQKGEEAPEAPLVPVNREGTRLPLSLAQQRLWFLDRLLPDSALYNISLVLQWQGELQVEALESSLNDVIARHETLRTTIFDEEGEAMQAIAPKLELALTVVDLQQLDEKERKAEASRLAQEDSTTPFDLAKGPLLRAKLLRMSAEEYLLVVCMHHIISDGWSMGVFVRDLTAMYERRTQGHARALPELSVQYADFAVWQREWLQGDMLTEQLSYWKQKLQGVEPLLQLPTDRPRPAVQTYSGTTYTVKLSKELSEGIAERSRQQGATLFMTLLAAFKTLLYRYTGQEDILVGSPMAGRNRSEVEELIGFFVNTLVLRSQLSSDMPFSELLTQVREAALGAYAHQDLPFERIVDELQLERSLSYSPLFQVMFALQNAPLDMPEMEGLTVRPFDLAEYVMAKFDLTLNVQEADSGMQVVFEYNTDLFDRETIARMALQFEKLLQSIVEHPQQRVSMLPLLGETEQQQLLAFSGTTTEYPREKSVHQLFEEQAAATPDAVAVMMGEETLTYGELNRLANQLAHYLQTQGVKRESLVGLCMERSLEMVVGMLGILKAGGAYVPLDPGFPKERLAYMLEDTQVGLLLTQERLQEKLPPHEAVTICLDADWARIAEQCPENPIHEVTADHLIYVIYTSGSTGKPKGVLVPHRGVVRLVKNTDYVDFSSDRVFLQASTVSFDAATFEIWGSLLNGARLALMPPETPTLEELAHAIQSYGVTTLFLTCALFNLMVDNQLEALCQVEQLLVGGEIVSVPHVRKVLQHGGVRLFSVYGPTESTTYTTYCPLTVEDKDRLSIPIGRPIANTQVYVLDAQGNFAPIGVPGELHIGGDGLARGYLNQKELTEERFIPNPFSTHAKDRLYKTGDLVRYLPDGNIEFIGRIDNQVKIRGFRIELGEIETVLMQHPEVRIAVVVAREDVPGDKRLVAYLEVESEGCASAVAGREELYSSLRLYLKGKMPDYMIPSAFVLLDSLPLTTNGKVDKKALPAPDLTQGFSDNIDASPRNQAEEVVANIWAQVLHLDQVGIFSNFFELGGHSLLATQVVSRLREAFSVELPVRALFEHPTVAELTAFLQNAQKGEGLQRTRIVPVNREDHAIPLSYAQQRLWFLDRLLPESALYNIPFFLRLQGKLQVDALQKSLQMLLERHESLRTTFAEVEEQPMQVIPAKFEMDLPVIDLHLLEESAREAELIRLAQEEANRPFDLNKGPLFRAGLVQASEQEFVLLLNMHHIVSDGWSMGVLMRELSTSYNLFAKGESVTWPELPIQYADYAVWQREWLQGDVLEEQVSYWRKQLDGAESLLQLPTDRPRPAVQTHVGAHYSAGISPELTAKLKELSQQEGVTLFITLLAAYQTLLYRYTGQEDILVGSPIANRNHQETEESIGFFVNTLVLRSQLSSDMPFSELLTQVREAALGAYAHQDLPFERIVDELQLERSLSYSPLFQVMFTLQNTSLEMPELEGLTVRPFDLTDYVMAKFDLTLSMHEADGGMLVVFEYNTDLFDRETIARMAEQFEKLLQSIVEHPQQRVSLLPLLSETEQQRLLSFSGTTTESPRDKSVQQLFEEQAAATPDAVAVIMGEEILTYSELNRRANQLAHYLQEQGVRAESLVCLCMERSLEMIVGMLGILKAGGAYVPLDHAYPKERLAYMLEDSKAQVIITQERLLAKLPAHDAIFVAVDAVEECIAKLPAENVVTETTAEHPAYVIYTSGSTGKPKGVCVPHRGIVRLVKNTNYFTFTSDQVFLQSATISFDAATFQIWGSLLNGARLVMMPPHMPTVEEFGNVVHEHGVTTILLSVGLFNMIVDTHLEAFQGVKQILVGGDALSVPHMRKAFSLEGTQLINGYGPTESTVFACCHLIQEEDFSGTSIPIGRPISNTQVYVLDKHGQPVPIGVPGELYIGGDGLAHGYLNRPDLTERSFVANPFSNDSDERLYRTGDYVRYLPDGKLEYLGRMDDQVKIRGFRIELGEIETVLMQHQEVQKAVVLAREDVPGEKRLVAYIEAESESDSRVDAEDGKENLNRSLRLYLKGKVPDYMIPSAFVILESLPLTANDKVDKKALPAPDLTKGFSDNMDASPRYQAEEVVANIWAQVLHLNQVGVYSNFFELGGHSLLATQVVSRLREAFSVEFPLRALFEYPTVAELTSYLQTLQKGEDLHKTQIVPVNREGLEIPLSYAQQRLWFLDRLLPESALYNIPAFLRLQGTLQVDALQKSLRTLLERHESLRTSFAEVEGQPMQVISRHVEMDLPVIDLRFLNEAARETELNRLAQEEANQPFDLTKGPLFRARLVKASEQESVLLLNMHHIVSDGWSMGVLLRELATSYNSFAKGESVTWPKLPIQYADYAVWQREWLQGDVLEEQVSYWREQLEGAESLLQLPTDRPRPAVQTHVGAHYYAHISPELTAKLKELSQQEGVTLFITLLAAYQTLLYRYTGQEDILVGSPIANRNHQEKEELIGFFVNTLVLRSQLSSDMPFSELLTQVWEVALGAYAHQDLPFERIVDELQLERSLSYSPLFQVMFALQNAPLDMPEMEGLTVQPFDLAEYVMAKFDLTLNMHEADGGMQVVFEYNTDLFDGGTIARMAEQFEKLLQSIVETPQQHVSLLPLLGEAEQQQLQDFSGTRTEYPREKSVHRLFEEQVAATPDAVAVIMGEETLTYGELNRRANQLAHYLQAQGMRAESLVGLCMERSLEMVVGMLGILKAGGTYVPLDPGFPKERLAYMLEDAGVGLLLTQERLQEKLPPHEAVTICLDTEWARIAEQSQENPINEVTADHLIYVIYTSGSTGLPKGVLVLHRGVVRLVKNTDYVDFSSDRVFLQASTVSFDAATFEIWGSLLNGARLALMPPETPTLEELGQAIRSYGITTMWLTVALFNLMVDHQLEALCQVEEMLVGGDVVSVPHARKMLQHGSVRLVNGYGPTESTTFTTCCPITMENLQHQSIPIGRPIANTKVYVLDTDGQIAPIGVPGELYIGGDGLARGYLNRQKLTEERFIPNPFSSNSQDRLYKTGDLVRYLADGNIEFIGRIDNQVKIRGFRIELGEIEATLAKHPAVRESTVLIHEGEAGEKRIVAYFVPDSATSCEVGDVRRFMKEQLPDYMVPSFFMPLDSLPLTPNGKVDRKALPTPDVSRIDLGKAYVAPRTEGERKLADIWKQVLRLEQVGIHDNFFELGGDSILSIQIVSRANQAGLRLTPKQMFEHQTIAELSDAMEQTEEAAPIEAEQGIVTGELPLLPIQRWFFEQNFANQHHFNQSMMLNVHPSLTPELLKQAIRELLAHHDALRLRFVQEAGEWKQINHEPEAEVPFEVIDLSGCPQSEQGTCIEATVERVQAGLNLTQGPIHRVVYFDLGAEQPVRLFMAIHHLAVDGVSWRILLEDLQTVCEQLNRGHQVKLPPKTTSYKQWAERLTEHAGAKIVQSELNYWLTQKEENHTPLPIDHKDGSNTERVAERVTVSLTAEETRALLQEVPSAYRTQINDVLLTALVQATTPWTGKRSLLVNLEGHGREEILEGVDLSRTVGWFTTMFPILLDIGKSETLADALKTVKEHLRSIPNKGIGYGLLRYCGGHEASLLELPHAEISFNYLGQFDQNASKTSEALFKPAEESTGSNSSLDAERSHLLDVVGAITGDRLHMTWMYSGELHERTTIERLADQYLKALRALIAHCQKPNSFGYTPSDFPLAGLNQEQLDSVVGENQLLEDLYPMTPLQQGLLFHSLYEEAGGDYVVQFTLTFQGNLREAEFEQAWQQIILRHAILRTSFAWENLPKPQQIVHKQVDVSWEYLDWRDWSSEKQADMLNALLQEDRRKGFDFSKPPMRFYLIRQGDETCQFVWSHHHVLIDGWSLPIVLNDVFALYSAKCKGQAAELGSNPPYVRYLEWLGRQDLQKAERYWRETLKGFTAPTTVEICVRNALETETETESTRRYAQKSIQWSEEQTQALQQFARSHQLTLNTLVQGAWSLLLSRYSGETDVVFGMTGAGRPADLPGVESMVGLFINTLPVRIQIAATDPVVDWLKQLQDRQAEMHQYEYSPLVDVQGWSDVPQNLPLFESLYVFENYPVAEGTGDAFRDLQISAVGGFEQTNYPISLLAAPGSQLLLRLMYDQNRFDDDTILRMLNQLTALLEGMAKQKEHRVAELPLLTEAEQEQMLRLWNDTKTDYPREMTVPELFEEWAAVTPKAIAVCLGEESLTYGELNRRANQLARYLQAQGVGVESLVGLCAERSLEMIVGLLGILKAGGAYVPLDPAYPKERLVYMLEDSQVQFLLTQQHLAERLPENQAKTLFLDADLAEIAQESGENLASAVTAESPAYVIYTSGSTGQPKGVCVPHRGIVRLVKDTTSLDLSADCVFLQVSTISFDAATYELWGSLLNGARLAMMPPHMPTLEEIGQALRNYGVTTLVLSTGLFHLLVDNQLEALQRVKQLLIGGDAMSVPHARKLLSIPGVRLFNGYGPSESTTMACCHPVSEIDLTRTSIPIGRPIANTEVYVLDEHRQPVPIGVPGELYIGGDGLAIGYLNRPELTAERFIPNPFSQEAGARLYKTGDLVRYLPDGNIDFIGRIDRQIKLRGFRIELGEIEAMLAQHPNVRQTAVLALEDDLGEKRLVAYLVVDRELGQAGDVHAGDWRRFLQNKLPDYMLPSLFIELDEMTLTQNGKVDHKALPRPDWSEVVSDREYVEPRNSLEEMLVNLLEEVLRRSPIGMYDNFFDLGGHSLLATQVISRLRRDLQIDVPIKALFESATIADFAAVVEEAKAHQQTRSVDVIQKRIHTPEEDLLANVDELSDEEIALLLEGFLENEGDSE